MTIDESARRLGALAWTERRLFEILGAWAASTPEATLKLALARASRHHGEHAARLVALLPDTRDHDPAALVVGGRNADAVDALAATTGSGARLHALLDDVLPRHLAAVTEFLGSASPIRDAPAIRALGSLFSEAQTETAALASLQVGIDASTSPGSA